MAIFNGTDLILKVSPSSGGADSEIDAFSECFSFNECRYNRHIDKR